MTEVLAVLVLKHKSGTVCLTEYPASQVKSKQSEQYHSADNGLTDRWRHFSLSP